MSKPTIVPNKLFTREDISLKAKGLYAYIYFKPDGWYFSAINIAKETKDGQESVLVGLKELEEAGYIKRVKLSNGSITINILK